MFPLKEIVDTFIYYGVLNEYCFDLIKCVGYENIKKLNLPELKDLKDCVKKYGFIYFYLF
jgi:hypothetical protein